MRGADRARGQASVELIAAIPLLIALLLATLQLGLVGWGLWAAAAGARAGARAQAVGGSPRNAALSAIPDALEMSSSVHTTDTEVGVTVGVPALVPGLGRIPLAAASALDPSGGS